MESEKNLFNYKEKEGKVKKFLLSSNHTIWPLFSRGCLLPSAFERTDIPLFDNSLFKLFLFDDKIPSNWCENLISSRRNSYPIALLVDYDEKNNFVSSFWESINFDFVSLDDVDGIYFRNERERDQFRSRSFDDLDLDETKIDYIVNEKIFEGKDERIPDKNEEEIDTSDYEKIMRKADGIAGIISCFEKSDSDRDGFIGDFCKLLNLDFFKFKMKHLLIN